jgi:hypothetical protein
MARKLTPHESKYRRDQRELYKIVDEQVETLYKAHVLRVGLEPNPVKRAAIIDKIYLRVCKTIGVAPREKDLLS